MNCSFTRRTECARNSSAVENAAAGAGGEATHADSSSSRAGVNKGANRPVSQMGGGAIARAATKVNLDRPRRWDAAPDRAVGQSALA